MMIDRLFVILACDALLVAAVLVCWWAARRWQRSILGREFGDRPPGFDIVPPVHPTREEPAPGQHE